ncbi:hypothetical protein [Telmatospirillum siberiense]|uniref:Flagellar protein FliL n=1 Tax=Telmatospirillum siberiense TaxID=382514 RepID=A0A2N3PT17_9PROT|nr:hypothetical protein [Telmatospirillum siberiense]PKU23545.1 hypothetical protein CWS72_15875 [Telmatospirillum siberiense]
MPGQALLHVLALAVIIVLSFHPADAKDIRLGGTNASPAPPPPPPAKLAPNIIELPIIVIAIRKEDGGWHHIRINAWLAPKDVATAHDMDDKKTAIVRRSKDAFPGTRGFEALQSARDGDQIAKEVIHAAAEHTIGRPWTGDVLIRNILIY